MYVRGTTVHSRISYLCTIDTKSIATRYSMDISLCIGNTVNSVGDVKKLLNSVHFMI